MRSIVVPINFSLNSANAARYAADLALAIDANIHLLNVYSLPDVETEASLPETVYNELKDSCLELLDSISTEITARTKGKVTVTRQVMTDHVDRQIEAYCASYKPYLVVMGAARGSLQHTLNGSDTVKALRRLRYPLLVVPEHVEFRPVQSITLACDSEDIASGMPVMLPFLKELTGLLGAHLDVVRVLTNGEDPAYSDINDYNVWKKVVKAFGPELHFVRRPTVAEGIMVYLKEHPADWLMVFPKTHSPLEFHRSRAKQIVLRSTLPILSVHE